MDTHWLLFLQENIGRKKQIHSNLPLLTVVIPSYCRQDFIIRQCAYWHGSGLSVVIMDGSPEPLASNLHQAITGLGDITYVHSHTAVCVLVSRVSRSVMP
jgi:hypothetical protein